MWSICDLRALGLLTDVAVIVIPLHFFFEVACKSV
jgi:hypothetical protein